MKTGLKEVAEKSGYAVSTVSLVLLGKGDGLGIKPATQRRIMNAAQTVGYKPDFLARSLRTGKTNVVVVIGSAYRFLIREMRQHAAAQLLREKGFRVQLLDFYWEQGREANLLHEIEDMRPEGILVSEIGSAWLPHLVAMRSKGIPIVGLDYLGGPDLDQVYIDREAVGYLGAAHLLKLGHRRIAYSLPPRPESWWLTERARGFSRACAEYGLASSAGRFVWPSRPAGELPYEIGRAITDESIFRRHPPTGLMAMNDQMAIGFMRGCLARGIRVPDRCSVVGAENLPETAYCAIPLTTIDFPIARLVNEAVTLLAERMNGRNGRAEQIRIQPSLVERESCRKLN